MRHKSKPVRGSTGKTTGVEKEVGWLVSIEVIKNTEVGLPAMGTHPPWLGKKRKEKEFSNNNNTKRKGRRARVTTISTSTA